MSLFRQFPAVAETHFEFHAEVFNLTNTPNFGQLWKLELQLTPNTFASISATRATIPAIRAKSQLECMKRYWLSEEGLPTRGNTLRSEILNVNQKELLHSEPPPPPRKQSVAAALPHSAPTTADSNPDAGSGQKAEYRYLPL